MQKVTKVTLEVNKRLEDADRLRLLHCIQDLEWQALMEVVLSHIEGCTQYSTDPGLAKEHGSVAYYAGGLAALRILLADLLESRDRGSNSV